jgi:drug/metabolite transporter (DMT)-like permease
MGSSVLLSLFAVFEVYDGCRTRSCFGFLLLFWALGRAAAAPIAAMMYFQPVAGVLLAWLFLGEPLGGSFLVGAVLMLTGVSLVALWPGQGNQCWR